MTIPEHLSPAMKAARAAIIGQGGHLMRDGVTRVDMLVTYIVDPDRTAMEAAYARISALLERSEAFRECYRNFRECSATLVAFETYEVTAVRAGLQVFQRLVPSEHLLQVLATHEALLGAWSPAGGVGHD